jgi:hypothetical protein
MNRVRHEALDEAHRLAVRSSVVAGAVAGAVSYAVGALRGVGHHLPSLQMEYSGPTQSNESVTTRVEVGADGIKRITRTKTTTNERGQRRVEQETLKSPPGMAPKTLIPGLPFPLPQAFDRKWPSLPPSNTLAGRIAESAIGSVGTAAWCALCTLPVARMEWRYWMFGQRALMLTAQPGLTGAMIGLRVLFLSWLGGAVVAGTVGSGGIALIGIPTAMVAGLPLLGAGMILYPIAHGRVASRIVRECIL